MRWVLKNKLFSEYFQIIISIIFISIILILATASTIVQGSIVNLPVIIAVILVLLAIRNIKTIIKNIKMIRKGKKLDN